MTSNSRLSLRRRHDSSIASAVPKPLRAASKFPANFCQRLCCLVGGFDQIVPILCGVDSVYFMNKVSDRISKSLNLLFDTALCHDAWIKQSGKPGIVREQLSKQNGMSFKHACFHIGVHCSLKIEIVSIRRLLAEFHLL